MGNRSKVWTVVVWILIALLLLAIVAAARNFKPLKRKEFAGKPPIVKVVLQLDRFGLTYNADVWVKIRPRDSYSIYSVSNLYRSGVSISIDGEMIRELPCYYSDQKSSLYEVQVGTYHFVNEKNEEIDSVDVLSRRNEYWSKKNREIFP